MADEMSADEAAEMAAEMATQKAMDNILNSTDPALFGLAEHIRLDRANIAANEVIRQSLIARKDELKIIVGARAKRVKAHFRILCTGTRYGLSVATIIGSRNYAETAVIYVPLDIDEKKDPQFTNTGADYSTIRKHSSFADILREIERVRALPATVEVDAAPG